MQLSRTFSFLLVPNHQLYLLITTGLVNTLIASKKRWLDMDEWEHIFQCGNMYEYENTEGTEMEWRTEGIYRVDFKENEKADRNQWSYKGEVSITGNPYNSHEFEVEQGSLGVFHRPLTPYKQVCFISTLCYLLFWFNASMFFCCLQSLSLVYLLSFSKP